MCTYVYISRFRNGDRHLAGKCFRRAAKAFGSERQSPFLRGGEFERQRKQRSKRDVRNGDRHLAGIRFPRVYWASGSEGQSPFLTGKRGATGERADGKRRVADATGRGVTERLV